MPGKATIYSPAQRSFEKSEFTTVLAKLNPRERILESEWPECMLGIITKKQIVDRLRRPIWAKNCHICTVVWVKETVREHKYMTKSPRDKSVHIRVKEFFPSSSLQNGSNAWTVGQPRTGKLPTQPTRFSPIIKQLGSAISFVGQPQSCSATLNSFDRTAL